MSSDSASLNKGFQQWKYVSEVLDLSYKLYLTTQQISQNSILAFGFVAIPGFSMGTPN